MSIESKADTPSACWVRLVLLLLLGLAPTAGADEAVFKDGSTVSGTLELDANGRLRFAPTANGTPITFSDCRQVRLAEAPVPPAWFGSPLRFVLHRDQFLTGELMGFEDKQVTVRTAWCDKLVIPRHALVSITQLPNFITIQHEDFEGKLTGWRLMGEPSFSDALHTSGSKALLLTKPGQSAAYALPAPLAAGRVAVNFCASDDPHDARWLMEAEFTDTRVRVSLAGPGHTAEVVGLPGKGSHLPASPGWHRLEVDFTASRLAVLVDDLVLWASTPDARPGPLRQVRLLCESAGEDKKPQGGVAFDDFALMQAVDELPRPPGDPTKDEIWLVSGDQLFGKIERLDPKTIAWRGALGERTLNWSEVRAVVPRRIAPPPRTGEGERVRVRLRWGNRDFDELEGVVVSLDKNRLVLRHDQLGELTIDRVRLHEVRSGK